MEDLTVANDEPFRQHREAALGEPGRLNVEDVETAREQMIDVADRAIR